MYQFIFSCDKQLKKGFRPLFRYCVRNAFSNMLLQVKGQLGYVLIGQEGSVESKSRVKAE